MTRGSSSRMTSLLPSLRAPVSLHIQTVRQQSEEDVHASLDVKPYDRAQDLCGSLLAGTKATSQHLLSEKRSVPAERFRPKETNWHLAYESAHSSSAQFFKSRLDNRRRVNTAKIGNVREKLVVRNKKDRCLSDGRPYMAARQDSISIYYVLSRPVTNST